MIRRPPRSTLTDTLFPYPTLFRPPGLTPLGEEIPIALIVAEQAGGLAEHRVSDVVRGHRIAVEMHANLSRRERRVRVVNQLGRSEEHTSELQALMRISYAVFCLKKKTISMKSKKHSYQQLYT